MPKQPLKPNTFRAILGVSAASDDAVRAAIAALREAGHTGDVRVAWEGDDGAMYAREGAATGAATVIAVGGDGTISAAVNGLMAVSRAPRPALGIIPFGTANDFAAMAGVPSGDPMAAMTMMLQSAPVPVDVGRMDERYFMNVATAGYPARMTTSTPTGAKRLLGGLAYLLTGLVNVDNIESVHARVVTDDLEWEGDLVALLVGNGRQAGGGIQVCPGAILDDGLLNVTIVPAMGTETSLISYIQDLLNMATETPGDVIRRRATRVELSSSDEMQVNLDGEPHQGNQFRFSVEPRALRVHLPATAPLVGTGE